MSNTTGWIKCSDRLPTKEDASKNGYYVHVYKPCGDPGLDHIIPWHQLNRDCDWLWCPWPKPPEPELNPVCPECGNSKLCKDEVSRNAVHCAQIDCHFYMNANTKTRAIELCNALPRKGKS